VLGLHGLNRGVARHVPTQRQEPFALAPCANALANDNFIHRLGSLILIPLVRDRLVHALDVFGDIAENVYVEKE
jgi:hypothetical protein